MKSDLKARCIPVTVICPTRLSGLEGFVTLAPNVSYIRVDERI